MKIIYLTKYPKLGASSRLRSYQYFPILQKAGHSITVAPLFDEAYVIGIFDGKTAYDSIIKGYIRRFFRLLTVYKYDLVVIEYELFPYFPAIFEFLLSKLGVKYVVDYDDAIFHNYNLSKNKAIRYFLGNKIAIVMKYSMCVLAGNKYLASYANKAGGKKIEIIPTVIDATRYKQKQILPNEKISIGWIGSPSTFKYLKTIRPVLSKLVKRYEIEVIIVGAKDTLGLKGIEKHVEWSQVTEVASILTFDIGVMPLDETPWAKGKCGYKLIQYMACGLPVICSPVGMNTDLVRHNVNGFLANSPEEWEGAFENLIESVELRKRMGQAGYKTVMHQYTVQVQANRLINIFETL